MTKLPVDNYFAQLDEWPHPPYTEVSNHPQRQMLWSKGELAVRLSHNRLYAGKLLLPLLAVGLIAACDGTPSDDSPKEDPLAGAEVYEFTILDEDIILGDADALVTVIEYANFSCSHCATFHLETFPSLKEQFIDTGKIRFVFREFTGDGPGVYGALLARCAGPDRYMAFADILFETQADWAYTQNFVADLGKLAASRGVGNEAFEACLKDEDAFNALIERGKQASEVYKLTGTPGFLINGKVIGGAVTFDVFEQIIEAALVEAGAGE